MLGERKRETDARRLSLLLRRREGHSGGGGIFFRKIFCNQRILPKNLDTEKVMGTGAKRRFCGENKTRARKEMSFFTFYF
jgi:hypothetical protein